jgi:hypothetical protein
MRPNPTPKSTSGMNGALKEFPNRVFESMQALLAQLESGLPSLCKDSARLRSITAWPWFLTINLKAN